MVIVITVGSSISIILHNSLNGSTGFVVINNTTFGVDPCPGHGKHIGAIVVGQVGVTQYFACEKGQTVDFSHGT